MTQLEQELLRAFEALSAEFTKSQSESALVIASLTRQVQDLTRQVQDLSGQVSNGTERLTERITRLGG